MHKLQTLYRILGTAIKLLQSTKENYIRHHLTTINEFGEVNKRSYSSKGIKTRELFNIVSYYLL